ncbi:MAG: hypothetical protein AB7L66_07255 [Gemmatimonadales bacterium]
MTLADLGFMLIALATIGSLTASLWSAVRRRLDSARRRIRWAVLVPSAYLLIVAAVGALSPGRTLALDEDYCADDWCIAVAGVAPDREAGRLSVTFRVSSRARRITQRERFVVAYVVDSAGTRIDPLPAPDQPPFDVRLRPSEMVTTVREFPLGTAAGVRLVITREGGGNFPGCCIIGADDSFFHRRAAARLDGS